MIEVPISVQTYRPWITNQLFQLLVNWLPFVIIVVHNLIRQKNVVNYSYSKFGLPKNLVS